MVELWLEQGWGLVVSFEKGRGPGPLILACEIWWKVWLYQGLFLPEHGTTMEDAQALLPAFGALANWCQRFLYYLSQVVVWEPRLLALAETFCRQWLDRFSQEGATVREPYVAALAGMALLVGPIDCINRSSLGHNREPG